MGAMGLNMVAALMERAPPKVLTSKDATSTQGSCVTFQNLRPGQSVEDHRELEGETHGYPSLQLVQEADNKTGQARHQLNSWNVR